MKLSQFFEQKIGRDGFFFLYFYIVYKNLISKVFVSINPVFAS